MLLRLIPLSFLLCASGALYGVGPDPDQHAGAAAAAPKAEADDATHEQISDRLNAGLKVFTCSEDFQTYLEEKVGYNHALVEKLTAKLRTLHIENPINVMAPTYGLANVIAKTQQWHVEPYGSWQGYYLHKTVYEIVDIIAQNEPCAFEIPQPSGESTVPAAQELIDQILGALKPFLTETIPGAEDPVPAFSASMFAEIQVAIKTTIMDSRPHFLPQRGGKGNLFDRLTDLHDYVVAGQQRQRHR